MFGAEHAASIREWGRAAGLWHDLGKFAPAWQRYLRSRSDLHRDEVAGKVDHSTAGAKHAANKGGFYLLLAYAIAGHHAGLPDGEAIDGGSSSLAARLQKEIEPWSAPEVTSLPSELPKPPLTPGIRERDHQVAFFARMLFSCLVDADFLATEAFMSPASAAERATWPNDLLSRMHAVLEQHLERLPRSGAINEQRRRVLAACRSKAALSPGLFTLTVPTGGGKTLSSLSFALRHALAHNLRRVIYVIPFTSIIEQNADEFRRVFAELAREIGCPP
ncbi:MAG: CRISPR-associated endonuclease Cas3'', partial [Chthoniobacterales bacterium]